MFRRAVAVTSAPAVSFVAASSLLASLRGVYAALPDLKKDPEAALPQLDYDYSKGIPPVMSPRQLELHYTKHHKAYVDKLNALAPEIKGKTIEAIAVETAKAGDAQKAVCNQAGQHFNHSFYWKCLRPGGSAAIPKPLEAELAKAFGSVDGFKQKYEASVMSVFGSGWTWLVYDPATQGLAIINTGNAALPQQQGLRPLLVTDVWEHAWAYQWENRRADYMKELWGITNWDFVAGQLDKARKE
jgi:Fe-Mn family superoxide dismutase